MCVGGSRSSARDASCVSGMRYPLSASAEVRSSDHSSAIAAARSGFEDGIRRGLPVGVFIGRLSRVMARPSLVC